MSVSCWPGLAVLLAGNGMSINFPLQAANGPSVVDRQRLALNYSYCSSLLTKCSSRELPLMRQTHLCELALIAVGAHKMLGDAW